MELAVQATPSLAPVITLPWVSLVVQAMGDGSEILGSCARHGSRFVRTSLITPMCILPGRGILASLVPPESAYTTTTEMLCHQQNQMAYRRWLFALRESTCLELMCIVVHTLRVFTAYNANDITLTGQAILCYPSSQLAPILLERGTRLLAHLDRMSRVWHFIVGGS